jgi:hypothetical protein
LSVKGKCNAKSVNQLRREQREDAGFRDLSESESSVFSKNLDNCIGEVWKESISWMPKPAQSKPVRAERGKV